MLFTFKRHQGVPGILSKCTDMSLSKTKSKNQLTHSLCQPREMGIFWQEIGERSMGKLHLYQQFRPGYYSSLVFTPRNAGICYWWQCRHPAGSNLGGRGSSAHAGEPEPIHPWLQPGRDLRGNPSPPNHSLSSSFDFSARATRQKDGSAERQALTGSSQLSSKKLQFCKQRSFSAISPGEEGAAAPCQQPCASHHPADLSPYLQVQGEIHLCHHQQQREERLCRGMGMERQHHHRVPGSHNLAGTWQRSE